MVVGETALYWRSFAKADEVGTALQHEDFGLLFFDHCGEPGDPMAFIESVRGAHKIPRYFEARQQQFKERMKQMLSAS